MDIVGSIRKRLTRTAAVDDGWEPVVRAGMFVPLQMRKRGDDGEWLYREPTDAEAQEYIQNEAW